MLKNTLQFSHQTCLPFININLNRKIENIKDFFEPSLAEKGIILLNKTAEHNIFGNPQQLRSLFMQLIENSIEAMSAGGEIEILSELKEDQCYIYIKDNGCGFESTENIFEPFVTTKPTGTGLGLAIVKSILDMHHGNIKLVSSRLGETIFEIILPTRGVE